MKKIIIILIGTFFLLKNTCISAGSTEQLKHAFFRVLHHEDISWMHEQIKKDLFFFKEHRADYTDFFSKERNIIDYYLKVTIIDNRCSFEGRKEDYRARSFIQAFNLLTKITVLPDLSLILCLHDGYVNNTEFPIFAMAKLKDDFKTILIPDFDNLRSKHEVLSKKSVLDWVIPWEKKQNKLMWRGSSAQISLKYDFNEIMTKDNFHNFSRVLLCELSKKHPHIIDAGFTLLVQGGENIPYLSTLMKQKVSYQDLFKCKYHILLDGNNCSYTNSGWKLFTNSLIFKPESPFVQWYYSAMKPYVHYTPIEADLRDLVEKIHYYQNHDIEAKTIANNARNFAITHLPLQYSLVYIYLLLNEYSKLLN